MLGFKHLYLRDQRHGLARRLAAATGCLWALSLGALVIAGAINERGVEQSRFAELLVDVAGAFGMAAGPIALAAGLAAVLVVRAPWQPGSITLTEQGLAFGADGARPRHVPYEAVRAGGHAAGTHELTLTLDGGRTLRVRGIEPQGADRILEAIAAGTPERALSLDLRRARSRRRTAAAAALSLAMLPALGAVASFQSVIAVMALAAAFGLAFGLLVIPLGREDRVVVGHDGVSIRGAGGDRFVGYDALEGVLPAVDGVALALADGARVQIRLLTPRVGRALDLALRRRDHLLAKIRVELAAYRAGGAAPIRAELLDRGGRPVAAWRAALRELCARATAAGYRAAAVDPEHLVRVLEARDAPAERRVGAAVALAAVDDPALRRRVRVFIDTCAGDELRRAIEAADEEAADEELERALAAVGRP